VGQRFIQLLEHNPWFEITAVAASGRSSGVRYAEACTWRLSANCPDCVRDLVVQPCEPGLDCEIVFSALPADIAADVEVAFAAAGYGVLSNASSHRMEPDVPLLVPEVNSEHLALIEIQRARRGWGKGFIVTTPNCSTVGLSVPLKPLHIAFGVRRVMVTTMQALSGASYPGVPSLDIIDNVVPYIGGEEDKMSREPLKILGVFSAAESRVLPAEMLISASCNRVATRDGHMEAVSVALDRKATLDEMLAAFREFRSVPYELGCPSAVQQTIVVRAEPDRPQPVLDRDEGAGMTVTVGRVRPCQVFDWKFTVLSHNTVRGAAGGSILNAEIMAARGLIG
jgi:aspartate-semialdehyde dehydrogenase